MSPRRHLDEQSDGNTLFDVEDVFVLATVGRHLLLLQVPMQVKHKYVIEARKQRPSHPAEGRIVDTAVVCDEAMQTEAGLLK